jgi:hypothetical protein
MNIYIYIYIHTYIHIHTYIYMYITGDFWRFCREFSITGAHFSAYDVCVCLGELQRNRRVVAREQQREQEETSARLAREAELALIAPVVTHKLSPAPKKGKKKNPNMPPTPPIGKKEKKTTEKVEITETTRPKVTVGVAVPPPRAAIPLKALRPAEVADLLCPASHQGAWPLRMDPRYPLREYEFVELFVRCAVRSHITLSLCHGPPEGEAVCGDGDGVDVVNESGRMQPATRSLGQSLGQMTLGGTLGGTLGQGMGGTASRLRTGTVRAGNGTDVAGIVYQALGEKLQCICSDWTLVPPAAAALYAPPVQALLAKHGPVLLEIFTGLCPGVGAGVGAGVGVGGLSTPPTLRDVLTYVLSLRQATPAFARPCLSPACGLLEVLAVACEALVDEVRVHGGGMGVCGGMVGVHGGMVGHVWDIYIYIYIYIVVYIV